MTNDVLNRNVSVINRLRLCAMGWMDLGIRTGVSVRETDVTGPSEPIGHVL